MPKRGNDYESDNGFVEDAPKGKKRRSGGNELKKTEGKATISKTRRVQVSTFKGAYMVNIREFYEKDGKALPGKKGISLSIDQFAAVLDILPDLEDVLQSKGVAIPRPKYDREPTAGGDDEEGGDEEEDEEVADQESNGRNKGKLDKFKMKQNHEATDDEDDE